MIPFEIATPPLAGTIRLRIRAAAPLNAADEAVVMINRSDMLASRWAISIRSLGADSPKVDLYVEDSALAHSLQKFTRCLAHIGIPAITVKAWDHTFDGFNEEAQARAHGVSIHV